MSASRYCPSCMSETDAAVCPRHGISTFPTDTYRQLGQDALLGEVIDGRYRVEALIGQGGMGRVYRALQLSIDRPVAIKVLKTRYAGDERRLARFRREARATSLLRHPNTIQVFDYGQTHAGHPYLVSELLAGRALEDVLSDAVCLPSARVVHIAAQMLRSLAEAHRAGIVHRDIKSSNIFLCSVDENTDFVKLLDFGVARFVDGSEDAHRITRTGYIVGTPSYMSPEQAHGKAVDARSDLYSVGVLLYEMLSGHLPFTATSAVALQLAHAIDDPPPIGEGGDGVPAALGRVVMQCLCKAPDDRPATAEALRAALEDALKSSLAVPDPPRPVADTIVLPALASSSPTDTELDARSIGQLTDDTTEWVPVEDPSVNPPKE